MSLLVLIDTWWNVNQGFGAERILLVGFNRYMVECESFYKSAVF